MRVLDALKLRLRSLLRGTSVERDLDEELRFHVESHVDELVARGTPREEARTIALRRFGGVDQVKESVRDTWHVRLLGDIAQDLRYGLRSLRHSPVFTAVAVLTLALGIGATTAIFSVVDGVLLKPLTYPASDRIVRVLTHWTKTGHDGNNLSGGDFVDARDRTRVFEAFSMFWGDEIGVRAGDRSELVGTWFVNTSFFDVFAVQPVAGRTFRADDVKKAAVVSNGYATQHFGSAPAALGRTISVDTVAYDIVGVMPAGFHFPELADVWVPVPNQPDNMNRSAHNYPTVARRRADISSQALDAAMATLSGQLATTYKDTNAEKTLIAISLQERMVGSMRATLYLLLGAVAILFLIACANVANLLLARASVRTREIALRSALGADRWRILRQLIVESLLLAAIGGVLGLVLAYLGTGALIQLAPVSLPRLGEVAVDRGVLAFAATASLVASLMFGLLPAWQSSRVDLRERLTEGGTRGSVGGGSNRLRTGLAVAEIGLAVVLAIGGGLLFRSFMALSTVTLGYRTSDVLVVQANLPSTDDTQDQVRVVDRLARLYPAIATVPGVRSVAGAVGLPMGNFSSNGSYAVEGKHTFAPGQKLPYANFRLASPGYFETIGVPLRRGRDFTAQDRYDAPFVVIVSEALVREIFPHQDPIGHRIQCGLDSMNYMTIVGVVADIRDEPGTPPAHELYMPIAQHPGRGSLQEIVVRTSVVPATLLETVRQRIRRADPDVATKLTTYESHASDAVATPRFRTWLVSSFAGLALLLAVAGVYGLLTYLTAQRTPELGLRMALGAGPAEVIGLVLKRAGIIAAGGLLIGVALSLVASRALTTMVFGTEALDPMTYVVVPGAVLVVTLAAAAVPAWRASRIDPLAVLREN
jgi:putative ABC transport system permease protein